MTRKLINNIALWGPVLLVALLMPALCLPVEWTQQDVEGLKWVVTVDKPIDPDWLDKKLDKIWDHNVSIEIIRWGNGRTSFVIYGSDLTNWKNLRDSMAWIERYGKNRGE